MSSSFHYSFPAVRGVQAGKEYYVVMCPLKLIPKIFLFDEEEIPPEFRAQRTMNRSRIPEITNYILNNTKDYVFSSLTASVDGQMTFTPFSDEPGFEDIGKLTISLDARFLINDGQHRRAAIEEALKVAPELGSETISVVFFRDEGLVRSQQIFADLNRHAVNTTSSLGILYDHRDQLAQLTRELVSSIPFLERFTDKERQSLPKLSPRLFTLNNIFNANSRILNKRRGDFVSQQEKEFIHAFWRLLCEVILEWQQVQMKQVTPAELRANYINAHGIFLEALGIIGNHLYNMNPTDWPNVLEKLSNIDWHRDNPEWCGRAVSSTGRINKNNDTIVLTANLIKMKLCLPLNEKEIEVENKLQVR
jgi:DNA sulfur modification protein DndB